MHAPGQLAVYPIVPLEQCGWTVGDYLGRFQAGLAEALADFGVDGPRARRSGRHLGPHRAARGAGVAVKDWVTYHGAFINVAPSMSLQRLVDSDPAERTPLSSAW